MKHSLRYSNKAWVINSKPGGFPDNHQVSPWWFLGYNQSDVCIKHLFSLNRMAATFHFNQPQENCHGVLDTSSPAQQPKRGSISSLQRDSPQAIFMRRTIHLPQPQMMSFPERHMYTWALWAPLHQEERCSTMLFSEVVLKIMRRGGTSGLSATRWESW